MSIYSCLADAARLGALSQGVDLAAALPAASDWKFDVPTAAGFVVGSVVTGLGLYLLVSLYFQLRYYRARRATSQDWKCQPQRFPTPRMWSIDLWLGITNITLGSVLSGFLAYWIYASGHSRIYISLRGHSILEVLAGTVLYFLITDVVIYWAHRIFHRPALFRLIHRWHHRNTVPTAFTAFSLHPVEFLTYQSIMLVPLVYSEVSTSDAGLLKGYNDGNQLFNFFMASTAFTVWTFCSVYASHHNDIGQIVALTSCQFLFFGLYRVFKGY